MGVEESFRGVIQQALRGLVHAGDVSADALQGNFTVERPKRAEYGDVATNAPLSLAKAAKKPPRELAVLLQQRLQEDVSVKSVDIAGPGFLNITLRPEVFHCVLEEIARAGLGYGHAPAATGERILLEFVSANPTGPLLISHARGALLGDAVARVLEAAGHQVTREYYLNDFGNQVRAFARSVAASAFGEPVPEEGYPGGYVDAVARYLQKHALHALEGYQENGKRDDALNTLSRYCVTRMLDGVPGSPDLPGIKATLRALRVNFDSWFSEESLHRWGRVEAALEKLARGNYLKTLPDGALVFQLAEGEGELDEAWAGQEAARKGASSVGGRVVRKNDGKTFTYFASDIAYHTDKLDRGYDRLITVLGADHHGYVARMRNVLYALGLPKERFRVLLFQLVSLVREGKPYKIGKRLGNLITVDEVLEEIDDALGPGAGADALRYFYLSRATDNPVELDVELAKQESLENQAIYLQYGHARLCSIVRNARDELGISVPAWAPELATKLTHPDELAMLQLLGTFPRLVREAAKELAPWRIIFFLQDIAQAFHSYYTQTKASDPILPKKSVRAQPGWESEWDKPRTLARLLWVDAIRIVYASGLALVGIRAPERMKRTDESPPAGAS